MPDLEQRFLDKNDSPLSLFEKSFATLVRLLGSSSSISKDYYYDLQSLVFPGKVCRFFTTKEDSVAKRMADGSKRFQAPYFGIIKPCEDQQLAKKGNAPQHVQCLVHTM